MDDRVPEETYQDKPIEEYDNPDGSVWVIGVDFRGRLFLVNPPNVWDGFYENNELYANGFPEDTNDVGPGIYRVTVKYTEIKDPDTWLGLGEETWQFDPVKWEPIYTFGEWGD